jgi:hypothetical protein
MERKGSPKKAKQNTTWATEVLREDHERIQDLFVDFDDPAEKARRREIVETVLAEARLHRALVEEILVPAVRSASGDPSALSDVQDELEEWEALLQDVESLALDDPGFASAWRSLRTELERHLREGDQGLVDLAKTLPLNYVDMGLRMAELRRQITAERPTASQDTSN